MKTPWVSKLKFLVSSTNAHGVHSPFIYEWITKHIYQNKPKNSKYQKLSTRFHKSLNSKQIEILSDSLSYFGIQNICTATSLEHGVFAIASDLDINISQKASKTTDSCFIASNQKKLSLNDKKIKATDNFCFILESPYHNRGLWNRLQEYFSEAIVIDTYYWGFIFLGKNQKPQTFKIRTNRFLKWDYKPVRL